MTQLRLSVLGARFMAPDAAWRIEA